MILIFFKVIDKIEIFFIQHFNPTSQMQSITIIQIGSLLPVHFYVDFIHTHNHITKILHNILHGSRFPINHISCKQFSAAEHAFFSQQRVFFLCLSFLFLIPFYFICCHRVVILMLLNVLVPQTVTGICQSGRISVSVPDIS